jgi:hypothetical protein
MTPVVETKIMKASGGPPESLFINLGTNDIIHGNRHWETDWNTLMKDTATVPCRVIFTISTVVDAYGSAGTHRRGLQSHD